MPGAARWHRHSHSQDQRLPPTESVDYAYTCVPTYPSGQIGFILCQRGPDAADGATGDKAGGSGGRGLRLPSRAVSSSMQQLLKYYTVAIHEAAFVLPKFAEQAIAAARK